MGVVALAAGADLISANHPRSYDGWGYDSWWDVAVAEVSQMESVQQARQEYEQNLKKERYFL